MAMSNQCVHKLSVTENGRGLGIVDKQMKHRSVSVLALRRD